MKRGGYIQRKKPLQSFSAGSLSNAPLRRRIPLHVEGKSDTATIKKRIQAALRQGVIARDGGCILRDIRHCNGLPGVPGVVLQADHLITRANSATFADIRLVVCVCKRCHSWKSLGDNMRKAQYDQLVKPLLSPDRVALWEKAEQDLWRPHPARASDWLLAEIALQQEVKQLCDKLSSPQ